MNCIKIMSTLFVEEKLGIINFVQYVERLFIKIRLLNQGSNKKIGNVK